MIIDFRFLRRRWWIFVLTILILFTYTKLPVILQYFYPIPHLQIIEKYSTQYEIDPLLVAAIINIESKFSTDAISRQGATGLMQLMPRTAEWVAKKMKLPFDQAKLFEPEYNLKLGIWYIAELQREFKSNPVLVLAAYNGGRGNVKQWLEDSRWQGNAESIKEIPFPETRNYVSKVLRRYRIYEYIYRGR